MWITDYFFELYLVTRDIHAIFGVRVSLFYGVSLYVPQGWGGFFVGRYNHDQHLAKETQYQHTPSYRVYFYN